uniref:Uncharacterized protein n=1 Tax=Siphoviridae sp. ctxMM9 TaxID=2827973 RepID=A0A8S5T747_9CAUD|nr:MAG TPA: hypothetical protein [Siphoviridae sp. ctxMM9]
MLSDICLTPSFAKSVYNSIILFSNSSFCYSILSP